MCSTSHGRLDRSAILRSTASFGRWWEGKTSVYISHRMSSCRFCDVVFVFDGGTIVQQGSHEALLDQEEGLYAQLWRAQAQYY